MQLLTLLSQGTGGSGVVAPRSTISFVALASPHAADDEDDWRRVLCDIVDVRNIGTRPITPRRIRSLAARFDEDAASTGSRRRSRRHRIERQVRLSTLHRSGSATVSARMLDASATGARLETNEPLAIGALCWVLVGTGETRTSGISFAARIVWRDPDRELVGIAFVGRAVAGPHVLP